MKNIIRIMLFSAFVMLFSSAASAEPVTYQGCLPPEVNAEFQTMSADEPQKPLTNQKLLTILIEFNDVKIKMGSDFWNKEMFDTTPSKLSVVNYWKENSNGLDIFEPADTSDIEVGRKGTVSYEDYTDIAYEIIERADGVVRISLDIPHPTPTGKENKNGLECAVNLAVRAIEKDFNFTEVQPYIVTIFSGYGQMITLGTEKQGHIRAYTSVSGATTSNGIRLKHTVQPEMLYIDIPDGIGTICHELGHSVFKLPDLYFKSMPSGASNSVAKYSLMSAGSEGKRYDPMNGNKNYDDPYAQYDGHVPVHLDPWCKIKCGFVTPMIVNDWDGNINSISDTETESKYNILKVMSKADPKQYFLIENRQLVGFDKGLEVLNSWSNYPYENIFNGGILIYHIDENVNYSHNNNTSKHLFMNIERSNNGSVSNPDPHLWAYLDKDGRNVFNTETTPNSNFHQAKSRVEQCSKDDDCHPQMIESGISIEVLDESSPSMRLRIRVDDEYKIAENGQTFSDVFPDINFCNAVIDILKKDDSIERNPNDVISTEDWLKILLIERLSLNDCNIEDLTGIQNFSKLTTLYCKNNKLTKLDLSKNQMLMNLSCSNNELTELDITKCEKLLYFHCENNLLKKLDVSGNTNLVQLYCFGNQLEELNLKNNLNLSTLHCYDNYMSDHYTSSINKFDDFDKIFGTSESSRFKYSPQKTLGWKYECENMSAGGDITVSYDSLTVSDFDVILALYKDNRLINLSESNQGAKSASLVLPNEFESGNGWSVKAFVWDSVSSMFPFDGAFEKEL